MGPVSASPSQGEESPSARNRPQCNRPQRAITNFFQLSLETLKFQPSIFGHCENVLINGHFPLHLWLFYRYFHKGNFAAF